MVTTMLSANTPTRWGWRILSVSVAILLVGAIARSTLLLGSAATLFGLAIAAFTVDGVRTGASDAKDGKRYVRSRHPGTFWFLVILYVSFGMLVAIAGIRAILEP